MAQTELTYCRRKSKFLKFRLVKRRKKVRSRAKPKEQAETVRKEKSILRSLNRLKNGLLQSASLISRKNRLVKSEYFERFIKN